MPKPAPSTERPPPPRCAPELPVRSVVAGAPGPGGRRRAQCCRAALWLGALLAAGGCHGPRPHSRIETVSRLRGLAAVEYDGLNLHLEVDPAENVVLEVLGVPLRAADLRPGDRFAIRDGRGHDEYYEVLRLDEARIVLKRTAIMDRSAEGRGEWRSDRVVALRPYRDSGGTDEKK